MQTQVFHMKATQNQGLLGLKAGSGGHTEPRAVGPKGETITDLRQDGSGASHNQGMLGLGLITYPRSAEA